MRFIDSHCHIHFESFDSDRAEILQRAHHAGVKKLICIGCRVPDAQKTLRIIEKYKNCFGAVSIHPADIEKSFEKDFEHIREFAEHKKVVAIGETGFDFFRETNPLEGIQKNAFEKHFELAKKLEKPLVIHSRSARDETLDMLQGFDGHPFVWHCFSEDFQTAERVIELGGMISFTGIVTFPKSLQIQRVAKKIPLENLMVETDAPFLAPVPHRGKRCEPAFVADTARYIADLRNMELEEFASITTGNAEQFFGLSSS